MAEMQETFTYFRCPLGAFFYQYSERGFFRHFQIACMKQNNPCIPDKIVCMLV